MNRNIFRLFAIIAIAGLVFTGCQKEENLAEPINSVKSINAEQTFPILKHGPVFTDPAVVKYMYDWEGNLRPVDCRVIRDTHGNKQEWIFADFITDFGTAYYASGDTYGLNKGAYHNWNDASSIDGFQSRLIYNSDGSPYANFHLPTMSDINNLAHMLGSTSAIKNKLQLAYDGYWGAGVNWETTTACMWINNPGDPNIVPGCGVFGKWDGQNNNNFWMVYPNYAVKVNVRLVRTVF